MRLLFLYTMLTSSSWATLKDLYCLGWCMQCIGKHAAGINTWIGTMQSPYAVHWQVAFFTEVPQPQAVRSITVAKVLTVSRRHYTDVSESYPIGARATLENLYITAEEVTLPSLICLHFSAVSHLPSLMCLHSSAASHPLSFIRLHSSAASHPPSLIRLHSSAASHLLPLICCHRPTPQSILTSLTCL